MVKNAGWKERKVKIIALSVAIIALVWAGTYAVKKSGNPTLPAGPGILSTVSPYSSVREYLAALDSQKKECTKGIDILGKPFYLKSRTGNNEVVTRIDPARADATGLSKDGMIDAIETACEGRLIFPEWTGGTTGLSKVDPASLSENAKFFQETVYPKDSEFDVSVLRKNLENKPNKTREDIKKLAFAYDFEGDYAKKADLCKGNAACVRDIEIDIQGTVKDQSGSALQQAKVSLLNDASVSTLTDKFGNYRLSYKANELSTLRLRATLNDYSDSVSNVYVIFEAKKQSFNEDFVLAKPLKILSFGKKDFANGTLKVMGNLSDYSINTKGLVDKNGKPVSPNRIQASVFEFDRSNMAGIQGYLHLDIFDAQGDYKGNKFVTYGMPYLTLRDENGNEIFVSKKNPSIIKDKIAHLEDLFKENQSVPDKDGTVRKTLTREDLAQMVAVSKTSKGYPIDSKYALANHIIMPSKWTLNVERWVWEEVGSKMLDADGNYEALFYNAD